MSFRSRLLATFLLAVLVPLIVLALFVRKEMTERLRAQYERRVESLVEVIEGDLAQESEAIAASLAVLRGAVLEDNRFRRAAVDGDRDERRYLLDYGANAMRLTGLSMLQIQNRSGRIISSGHFRNEFDRLEPELPALLASAPEGIALVKARAPDAPFLALAGVDSFQMGNEKFTIVAGVKVEQRFLARLAREEDLTVVLVYPDGVLFPGAEADRSARREEAASPRLEETTDDPESRAIVRELSISYIDPERGELGLARFRVAHSLDDLEALRRSVDRWFAVAVAAAVVLSILLVSWLASRISRPLVELADKTSRIDLDRLDIDFETDRRDEVGALSRLLGAMTNRLRASAALIKDAERRATLGEVARQVNHDIKNGLTPIRNVFRHLFQLAKSDPERLPEVFAERQNTLDSGISYLENLASQYARLSPRSERRPCDVNEIVRRVVADLRSSGRVQELRANLCREATVLGDPLSLRRVLENLLDNAIDSLESRAGGVVVFTELDVDRSRVRITVEDQGVGMGEERQKKIFDDFYTTKDDGTGLGLSIVRRLVMDLDGSIRVESEENKGSRFIVDLPASGPLQGPRTEVDAIREDGSDGANTGRG